jgi:hypothetical protein
MKTQYVWPFELITRICQRHSCLYQKPHRPNRHSRFTLSLSFPLRLAQWLYMYQTYTNTAGHHKNHPIFTDLIVRF